MKRSSSLKTASVLGISILGLTTFASAASAQTTPLELADVLNPDMDQVVEINTNAANPIGPMLEGMADSLGLSADATDAQIEALKTVLSKNNITIATKNNWNPSDTYSNYQAPDTYLSFHVSGDDLENLGCTISCATGTEKIAGVMVYAPEGDDGSKFITYLGDLFIMTSSRATMNNVINNYNSMSTAATLGKSASYQEVRGKVLPGSFLNMYVNPMQSVGMNPMDAIFGSGGIMSAEKDLMSAMKAEGISVAQTGKGFNFSVFVKGDSEKLTQLNLAFDRYNFVPELYKYINSNNVIMFGEESNLQGKVNDLMKLFMANEDAMTSIADMKTTLKSKADIDFDTEILPLFTGKYALSIHKTNQIWPAVTLVLDVRNMRDKAGYTLNKFMTYADKTFNQMEKEQGVDFYNRDVVFSSGNAFFKLTFDPTKAEGTDSEIKNLGSEKTMINVEAAVTNEGFLVITNAPNINDVYTFDGKGMTANATFNQAFTAGENLAGVGYFNFDTLQNYVDMMMDTFSAPTDARTFFDGVLDPWHEVFTKGYATTDTASATGFVNVDVAGFDAYPALFQNAFGSSFEDSVGSIQRPEGAPAGVFCDVEVSDWFATYVDELSSAGIVSGYPDGCFKPANSITRAEFVKMALYAADRAGDMSLSDYEQVADEAYYNDQEGWYYHNLSVATDLGYIHADRPNFRPNEPISRAEAVQILFNISENLKNVNMTGGFDIFSDVHGNDWFVNAVHAAYAKGLVKGVSDTIFEPNRNINRAEAAKIIKLFIDLESVDVGGDY